MLGLLVVTHGRLAEELVTSTQKIVGQVEGLAAVSIDWNDDMEDAARRVDEGRNSVDRGEGVLILTDMFGGTPTNLALALLEPGKVEIVTGVNLSMLIKFVNLRGHRSLLETADSIAEEARQAIRVASRLLRAGGGNRG